MHTFAAAGAGFLPAVLWFDLMFDVQTRKHTGDPLPPEVLTSISAYYRRVTTEAYPMNRVVALMVVLTLAAICAEIVLGENLWWIGWGSLALVGSGLCRPRFAPSRTPAGWEWVRIRRKSNRGLPAQSAAIICWASRG
ncbi:MAG: rane protein [Bradyrhizobium sp.]|jgi:hypothetical protein|nr:rane protein [Bradyrhizobium sp.]